VIDRTSKGLLRVKSIRKRDVKGVVFIRLRSLFGRKLDTNILFEIEVGKHIKRLLALV